MTHAQHSDPVAHDALHSDSWWVRLLPPTESNLLKVSGKTRRTFWWRLVWCHERCHKGVNNRTRCRSIRDAIAQRGGKLVALRKAAQFLTWAEDLQVLPYVVVTDWREAQPLINSLMVAPPQLVRPSLIVILCESPRQHRRAYDWTKRLPSNIGSVIACSPTCVPNELLDGVLAKYFTFDFDVAHENICLATGVTVTEDSKLGQSEAPTREPSDVENDHKEHLIPTHRLELAKFVCDSQEHLIPTHTRLELAKFVCDSEEESIFPKIPEPMHLCRGQDGQLVIRTCQGNNLRFAPGSWTNTPAFL